MSFIEVEYVEEADFSRIDLTPYREVFDGLKPGVTATLTVPTGELYDDGPNKGKGKEAMGHLRGFQKVAKERNVGLRAGLTNMPNGKTRLRLRTDKKREFTPEAVAKRTAALKLSQHNRKVDAYMVEHPDVTREVADKAVKATAKAVPTKA